MAHALNIFEKSGFQKSKLVIPSNFSDGPHAADEDSTVLSVPFLPAK